LVKTDLVRAFDEIEFGPDRTLNLRDSMPSAADARHRAEAWLRQRQSISRDELLIVTGRGKGSPDGVPIVKAEIVALLHVLRRQGVVKSWREHSAGALVVEPNSMTELLSAPRRHRDAKRAKGKPPASVQPISGFEGINSVTQGLLRQLAELSLQDLGIRETDDVVGAEMARQFSQLVRGLPDGGDRESSLQAVIIRAIEELNAG
jgi:hypothetical protein